MVWLYHRRASGYSRVNLPNLFFWFPPPSFWFFILHQIDISIDFFIVGTWWACSYCRRKSFCWSSKISVSQFFLIVEEIRLWKLSKVHCINTTPSIYQVYVLSNPFVPLCDIPWVMKNLGVYLKKWLQCTSFYVLIICMLCLITHDLKIYQRSGLAFYIKWSVSWNHYPCAFWISNLHVQLVIQSLAGTWHFEWS